MSKNLDLISKESMTDNMNSREISPLLKIKGVKKSFFSGDRKNDILKGVNLEIYPGEFVVIIGPSGCGKTTLLNTILGLERPDEGQVLVAGTDVYGMNEDERAAFRSANFGVVYQESNWVKSLNVLENIALPLRIAGLKRNKALDAARNMLYLFRFEQFARKNPAELSGGEQQKLAVGRALVPDPLIIMADEPTGSLDSVTAEDLMYDLRTLNVETGKTAIMVTHNPDYERYASKFVQMEDGVVKQVRVRENVLRPQALRKSGRTSSFWTRQLFLADLAFKNFKKYKARTLLTSGGVALSIGFISFLIALSYGFQKLTTEGVQKMSALQILNVDVGGSEKTSIDQPTLDKISNIFGVEKVYPLLSLAGDFSFHGKKITGAIYGRSGETLNEIERPSLTAGNYFSGKSREVLVNTAALKALGINQDNDVLNQNLKVQAIVRPELLEKGGENFQSKNGQFKIVGITSEGDAPYIYMPLTSLEKMGIVNFSGAEVKITTVNNLDSIKSLIEHMGFQVSSIKDTIDQANQFFSIFRVILIVFGAIAIIVSCIGMFNTLTISLVEKTREIGLLKTMGATRRDIKRIFILDTLFIGLIGGMTGVVLSYILGEFFNLSIYALAKTTGNSPIQIFVFPPLFLFAVLAFSVFLSIITGIYPAKRASKISALNALRYE